MMELFTGSVFGTMGHSCAGGRFGTKGYSGPTWDTIFPLSLHVGWQSETIWAGVIVWCRALWKFMARVS